MIPRPAPRARVLGPLPEFVRAEVTGGIVLGAAAAAALVWANLAAGSYADVWHRDLTLGLDPLTRTEDLQHWINDGLMTVFFFVVSLEIKREVADGELRERRAAALPVLAAAGGVLLPALVFLGWTVGSGTENGWGIPVATDIAFALGVLALLGDRVPLGAKLFLLAIAIVDDIIAIAIIAVAYSTDLAVGWLVAAAAALLVTAGMRKAGVVAIWPYLPIGALAWVAMLESGVHATLAGVALGLLTPAGRVGGRDVIRVLEHRLHPVSAVVIVPLFALANAGVQLDPDLVAGADEARLAAGVAVGLVVGKVLGVASATFLAQRLGVGVLPPGVTTRYVWGTAALAGVGLTVSLFIADLAFTDPARTDVARMGILAGSVTAAALGAAILFPGRHPRDRSGTD